jgi:hypothetical protein
MRSFLFLYLSLLSFTISIVTSCNQETKAITIKRAFYYWQSGSGILYQSDTKLLDTLGVEKLYMKFFELIPDENLSAIPSAKMSFNESDYHREMAISDKIEIIPVVYILNSVFTGIEENELDALADNTIHLLNKYLKERFYNERKINEIQIDCDWTKSTGSIYFRFLQILKQKSAKKISCTLRLYPYKYRQSMGIPPVDRVMLMCYNLVNPLQNPDMNSILQPEELEKYLTGNEAYPLPIDISLPVFSYHQWYRNGRFMGLLENVLDDKQNHLKPESNLWYLATHDFHNDGYHFIKAGDRIKIEKINTEILNKTIALLNEYIDFRDDITVTLFHLHDNVLNNFTHHDLENIYSFTGNSHP